MDSDSYGDESEIAYSDLSEDSDYGFDTGADEQPRARQVKLTLRTHHCHIIVHIDTAMLQAEYVILTEEQLRVRQQELTETTQAVLGLDEGSAAHALRHCNWYACSSLVEYLQLCKMHILCSHAWHCCCIMLLCKAHSADGSTQQVMAAAL